MTLRILAIDDRYPKEILAKVREATAEEVYAPSENEPDRQELKKLLRQLIDLAKLAFGGKCDYEDANEFNNYDLILLDYSLTEVEGFDIRLTADHLAGYIRALTDAPYVVSLNKLKGVDFDLKYLLGDFETKADLALNTEHLSIKGLWSGAVGDGDFCPWYWPRLQEAANRRRNQVNFVEEHIDDSILHSLGFPEEAIEQLSSQAIAFLSPEAGDRQTNGRNSVQNVTFWQHFRSSSRTLARDDRCRLFGGPDTEIPKTAKGLSDNVKTIAARVVAGELDFWFRRDILGPQRLLIDSPHLQAKYRFRPGEGDDADPQEWSATAKELIPNFGLADEFYDTIKAFEFKQTHGEVDFIWTDKPCFWLPQIEACQAFIDLAEQHPKRQNNLVFCEDTRRFVNIKEISPYRFETALGRGIDVRYIENLEEFNYSPRSQLAR
jgi:hypothetical protein